MSSGYMRVNGEFHVLKNPALKVDMVGFQSDLIHLRNNGWEISVHENMDERQYSYGSPGFSILIHHRQLSLLGSSGHVRFNYEPREYRPGALIDRDFLNSIIIPIKSIRPSTQAFMSPEIVLEYQHGFLDKHRPVEPYTTRYVSYTGKLDTFDMMKLFKPIETDYREIFIEKVSVQEMLNMILDKQDPARQEYFAKKVAEDNRSGVSTLNTKKVAELRMI